MDPVLDLALEEQKAGNELKRSTISNLRMKLNLLTSLGAKEATSLLIVLKYTELDYHFLRTYL